ncbi:MAG: DUF6399 domain-containing protein [Cyanobacteria bacterium J06581_3]
MSLIIRERSLKVADCIKTQTCATVQSISRLTGIHRSSVYRHRQAIARRNQHPESSLWESEVGHQWLVRLVFGLVYYFGIKQGVGAESLSEFIKAVHLDTHVASSPSALRQLKGRVTQVVSDYGEAQAAQCQPKAGEGICVGADETFFGLPVLVLIELSSGFIFIETECENRTYQTWMEQVQAWQAQHGWHCHYLVSDGARALVKLAVSGLGCVNVADLFHAMRALSQPLGQTLARRFAALKKQPDERQQQQLQQDNKTYHYALEVISQAIHPFAQSSSRWQTERDVLTQLAPPLQQLWNLAHEYRSEKALAALDTFENQVSSFAQGINAWQQWVTLALEAKTSEDAIRQWVRSALLPWVYWLQQADKTRQPALKRSYQQAASDAFDRLVDHSFTQQLTDDQQQQWVRWCREFCTKYQRTSSAVEGRNGYLAKLHHARRDFSEQSLKVLTIIHNFDLKRDDGTTAAQRLFGHEFPDPFEWMLETIGELPMPRRSAKAQHAKTAYVDSFSA